MLQDEPGRNYGYFILRVSGLEFMGLEAVLAFPKEAGLSSCVSDMN